MAMCLADADSAEVKIAALQLLRAVWEVLAADEGGEDRDADSGRLAMFRECGVLPRLEGLKRDPAMADPSVLAHTESLMLRILVWGLMRSSTRSRIGRACMTDLQGECSHRRVDSVRRFNVSEVLVINDPSPWRVTRAHLRRCAPPRAAAWRAVWTARWDLTEIARYFIQRISALCPCFLSSMACHDVLGNI